MWHIVVSKLGLARLLRLRRALPYLVLAYSAAATGVAHRLRPRRNGEKSGEGEGKKSKTIIHFFRKQFSSFYCDSFLIQTTGDVTRRKYTPRLMASYPEWWLEVGAISNGSSALKSEPRWGALSLTHSHNRSSSHTDTHQTLTDRSQ